MSKITALNLNKLKILNFPKKIIFLLPLKNVESVIFPSDASLKMFPSKMNSPSLNFIQQRAKF